MRTLLAILSASVALLTSAFAQNAPGSGNRLTDARTPSAPNSVTTEAETIEASEISKYFKKPGYSPYAGRNYPTRVFWGDEHIYTSWSPDAGGAAQHLVLRKQCATRGEELVSSTGQPVKLSQPLDWIAVTDHSGAWTRSMRSSRAIRSSSPIARFEGDTT